MPVDYTIASRVPQIASSGIDPLNMMAQLRQQEYQQAQLARMAQSMDVQDMQARIAAERDLRQAQAAERQAGLYGKQTQEIEDKILANKLDIYKNMFQNFVNDQKSLDSYVSLMEKDFPQGVAAFKGKSYSNDWKQSLLKPEGDYMESGGQVFRKTPRGLVPATVAAPEAIPGPRQDLATNITKGFEGFRSTPYFDVNADRVGYGSSTVTREDGTVEKVRKGMAPITELDAERDLQRRIQTEFVPKAAAKVGEDVWSGLPENTRAALTSVAYNYGNIPSRIVPAVQSGNPEAIARAIEGLAEDNKGVNAGRRMQEANIARGTGMPGSQAVPAFAAGGPPTFMGGPQIQPPINMMAGPASVANAMAAPAAAPSPMQPMTVAEYAKRPLKEANTKFFGQLLQSYEEQEKAGVLPSKTEGKLSRAGKVFETSTGELGRAVTRVVDPAAQELRDKTIGLIDQYIQRLRESGSMTGGEGNTMAELEAKKAMLGRGNMTIDAIRSIVKSLDENLGTGSLKVDSGSVTVNVPGVGAVPFPSKEAAEAFKREAGLQ